ncbi:MAG: pyrimidine 5'-nucleotidase [Rubrivivax sp.]
MRALCRRRHRTGRRHRRGARDPVWLFDLDNTLHDASAAAYGGINEGMTGYIERELDLSRTDADALRRRYWKRYGATLLGLMRHHAVTAADFLHHVHLLPGLESRVRGAADDIAALSRLPGRRYLLTNAPLAYALRVLRVLKLARHFDGVLAIEQLRMFGHWRPKPDARMARALAQRLRVPPQRCVLVEDSLANLKSARKVGMQTVWMQRWLQPPRQVTHGDASAAAAQRLPAFRHEPAERLVRRPAYVRCRTQRLRHLQRLC